MTRYRESARATVVGPRWSTWSRLVQTIAPGKNIIRINQLVQKFFFFFFLVFNYLLVKLLNDIFLGQWSIIIFYTYVLSGYFHCSTWRRGRCPLTVVQVRPQHTENEELLLSILSSLWPSLPPCKYPGVSGPLLGAVSSHIKLPIRGITA